jgi:hypothetical protein
MHHYHHGQFSLFGPRYREWKAAAPKIPKAFEAKSNSE